MEGQRRRTRRRMGNGTVAQSVTEQERSVSARKHDGRRGAARWCPELAPPISRSAKWWRVERKSEEAVVAPTAGTTQPCPSEGPPAGCAPSDARDREDCRFGSSPRPSRQRGGGRLRGRSGAWVGRQRSWRSGMRPVDCPGESRMRENLMSGLGRGRWKRGRTSRHRGSRAGGARRHHDGLVGNHLDEDRHRASALLHSDDGRDNTTRPERRTPASPMHEAKERNSDECRAVG